MMTTARRIQPDDPNHPARRAAKAYKRRCWWASYEDLVQSAFVATTKAETTFDPNVGVPLDAYLFRAAVYALKPVLLKDSSPVSARRCEQHMLKLMMRVDLRNPEGDIMPADDTLADQPASEAESNPEVLLPRVGWKARVRERLTEILTDTKHTERVLPVLLDEADSCEVAREHDVPVREIYLAAQRARRRIAADLNLWKLWRDL
jgi:DNA-directed RNA polymerase specialized sigma24 family protein